VNASSFPRAVDLEWIDVAEADRRSSEGQTPVGLMLGAALFRQEMARQPASGWLRHARRIVVCEGSDQPWFDPSPLGAARVRFLSLPFSPRSFDRALAWLGELGPRWQTSLRSQPPPRSPAA
jgi:hypothetical protein